MVLVSQLLYGTDYPFRGGAEVDDGSADASIPRLKQT